MASNLKTYLFMTIITLVSSMLLSYSYSSLKQRTDDNVKFDIKRNIVKSAGYDISKMSKEDIVNNYETNIKEIILDTANKEVSDILWENLIGIEDKKMDLLILLIKKIK